jgi:hypothetical protein
MALNTALGDRHLHADIREVRTIRNIVKLVLDEQARRRS